VTAIEQVEVASQAANMAAEHIFDHDAAGNQSAAMIVITAQVLMAFIERIAGDDSLEVLCHASDLRTALGEIVDAGAADVG
tara:strand:- start:213 stop:455 length:243 start_codon:yes stop_codon:yes gene_type:complete